MLCPAEQGACACCALQWDAPDPAALAFQVVLVRPCAVCVTPVLHTVPHAPGGGDCGVFAPGGSRLIDAAGTAKRPRTIYMLALLAHHPFSGPRLLVPNLGLARVAGCGMLQQGVAGSEVRTVCCQEVLLRLRLPAVHVLCSSQADHAVDLMLKQGQAVRQVA